MTIYYVESQLGWFLISAKNKRQAHSAGVAEYGRGYVKLVREATKQEIEEYIKIKGEKVISEK